MNSLCFCLNLLQTDEMEAEKVNNLSTNLMIYHQISLDVLFGDGQDSRTERILPDKETSVSIILEYLRGSLKNL